MALLLSIILSGLFGLLLFLLPDGLGFIVAGAILVGVLFRILFLVSDIHKRVSSITGNPDKAREAYERYMKEKDTTN